MLYWEYIEEEQELNQVTNEKASAVPWVGDDLSLGQSDLSGADDEKGSGFGSLLKKELSWFDGSQDMECEIDECQQWLLGFFFFLPVYFLWCKKLQEKTILLGPGAWFEHVKGETR